MLVQFLAGFASRRAAPAGSTHRPVRAQTRRSSQRIQSVEARGMHALPPAWLRGVRARVNATLKSRVIFAFGLAKPERGVAASDV
jgi:hypothetical protein